MRAWWLVAMLAGCKPDSYDECERSYEIRCDCDGSACQSDAFVEKKCTEYAKTSEAEQEGCFNDVLEETCDEGKAYEECFSD